MKKGVKIDGRSCVPEGGRPQKQGGRLRTGIRRFLAVQRQKEQEICRRLYGNRQMEDKYRQWQMQRQKKMMITAACGCGAAVFFLVSYLVTDTAVSDLARPFTGAETKTYPLTAQLGQEPEQTVLVEIPARRLSEDGCEKMLEEARQQLSRVMPGKNSSLEYVEQDLFLPDTLCSGLVKLVWESSDGEIVDTSGHVYNEVLQEEQVVVLTAQMSCQEKVRYVTFPVRVAVPQRDRVQQLTLLVEQKLQGESEADKTQEWFRLPDSYDGLPLKWSFSRPPYGIWILFLTAFGCLGIYAASFEELKKQEKERENRILTAYPGFVARLTMLAGTGMPLRVVFFKMAKTAQDRACQEPIYEEIQRACHEMESGITQKNAVENWGKRCRIAPCRKCAALLNQNMCRGADGLLEALWQEAESACEQRRALARKKGEEAQTKLLFPMILMLLVVMILVMVPAIFSFAGM